MGSKASIPQNVREYFAKRGVTGIVKIVETFGPNGWIRAGAQHSLSKGRILGLKRQGITRVGLRCGAPPNGGQASTADFGIDEMMRAPWAAGEIEPAKLNNLPIPPEPAPAPPSSGPLPDTDGRIRELAFAALACHSTAAQLDIDRQRYRAGKLGMTADEIAEADRLSLELRNAASESGVMPRNVSRWAEMLPAETIDACATRAALGEPAPAPPARPSAAALTSLRDVKPDQFAPGQIDAWRAHYWGERRTPENTDRVG